MPAKKGMKKTHKKRIHKKRTHKKTAPKGQMARTQETTILPDLLPNVPNIVSLDMTLFPRSTSIGQQYQEYKMTKVTLKWTPNYDTFQQGASLSAGISLSAPQLWGMVDRQGMANNTRFSQPTFEAFGVKPVKWTRDITRSFIPNIVIAQGYETAGDPGTSLPATSAIPSMVKKSPWLSTQYDCGTSPPPTQPTRFNGYVFFIEQDVTPAAAFSLGDLAIVVDFEFRKPAVPYTSALEGDVIAKDILRNTNIISKLKNISVTSPLQEEKK
nr:MAG: capsid protein [Cressdnaviricota sp.]